MLYILLVIFLGIITMAPTLQHLLLLLIALLSFNAHLKPTTSSNSTDSEALLSFKSSLSSDPFSALNSWDTNNNQSLRLCQWRGVTCGDARHPDRVTSLVLESLGLAGTVSPALGRLGHLQVLSLSNNSFSSEIPSNLSQCRLLTNLFLDTNFLVGEVPSELGSLPNLLKLKLYDNNLTGQIPASLGNLSSLVVLDLSGNSLVGNIPADFPSQMPNLGFLQLSINRLSGELSPSIFNSSSIYYFDIGSNEFYGALPPDTGSRLPIIRKFYLYSNRFRGSIPAALCNASRLERIGIEGNEFRGLVPPELGTIGNLSWLALGNNQLEAKESSDWGFLDNLANCSINLQILEISDNMFGGVLPGSIRNLSTQLTWLSMEDNYISGIIPAEIGRYVNLSFLSMYNNFLSGSIPATIGSLQSLNILRLSGNRLSGEIPSSLGNLSLLNELHLGGNGFQGRIPASLGSLGNLNLLNLSCNKLAGQIPREVVSLSSLTRYLDISHNSLMGDLPSEIGSLINLVGLNVSNNELSGKIPSSLGDCQVLTYLNMEDNLFQGAIPSSLSSLKGVQVLDLSRNNLSGKIPDFLESIQYLHLLNLSFNDLEGQVPTEGIFGNVSQISLVGNVNLCGGDQKLHLQACPSSGISKQKHSSPAIKVIIISVSVVIISLSLLGFYFWVKFSRKMSPLGTSPSMDYDHSRVTYDELFKATDGFSPGNLIGVGGFGYVYKGFMYCEEEKKIVAVKVLNFRQRGASRSFMAECEALRSTRHRNLVKILKLCVSVDSDGNEFRALVFEYMPNGNLDEWLHGAPSRKLCFIQRLNIAIDVGFGLDYLHHYGPTPIVHCDLKPSNVLLDADMVARVSDFGLAKILINTASRNLQEDSESSMVIQGTIGYVPPEYGMGRDVSTHGDVYSYGILLLEMLTGRRPTDETLEDGINLPKYVEMKLPEGVMDIIDPELLFEEDSRGKDKDSDIAGNSRMQECLVLMIRIALSCCSESSRKRREMGSVVNDVVAARHIFLSEISFETDINKK